MLVYWVGESRGPKARFLTPPPLDEFALEAMRDGHSNSSFTDQHLRGYLKDELTKMESVDPSVKCEEDSMPVKEQAPTAEQAPPLACV